ncbi:MAG: FtsH protease activity modulator HflK [Alphaproteobacteria bacterium]|nr:FtsH protease activity modulator HflK [Alphaproteobacteria bacterium]
MAGNNSGGPWGGSGNNGGGNNGDDRGGNHGGNHGGNRGGNQGGGRGPDGPQIPEIEDIVRKGQEQLRVLMGGRGGSGGSGGVGGPNIGRGTIGLVVLALIAAWLFASFYSVKPDQKSVELLFGKYYATGEPGLNFAPWPIMSKEVLSVSGERTEDIGANTGARASQGLMLTGDENIVDIDFQVVWNITDPAQYLFNLANPVVTIRAVSESAMREIISRSMLAPILNKDRGVISAELQTLVQGTLDSYKSGINIVRINFERADPPKEVIDSFREVQAAEQTRDTLQKQADAYSNKAVAAARGEAAQLGQEAEGYRARVINGAEGEASRFSAVYAEYVKAPEVTRKRLYLETMEKVLGSVKKVIIDEKAAGPNGVVPYLPLSELKSGVTK